jgi:hypothetical protein
MDTSQQKAQFSLAYAHAVATVAGFKMGRWEVDDDSVDFTIGQSGGDGTVRSPRLDIQLKCTERDVLRPDGVHFPLKRKNYDDLRQTELMVPKILVVLLVPERRSEWLTEIPEQQICLHRFAWWASLAGADERVGVETPTVVLPRAQLFNPESLKAIMQKVAGRASL